MRKRALAPITAALVLAVPLAVSAATTARAATTVGTTRNATTAVAGSVWTTGYGGNGQLGNGGTASRSTFGSTLAPTDIVQVSGGREHVLALEANGQVWAWATTPTGRSATGRRSTP